MAQGLHRFVSVSVLPLFTATAPKCRILYYPRVGNASSLGKVVEYRPGGNFFDFDTRSLNSESTTAATQLLNSFSSPGGSSNGPDLDPEAIHESAGCFFMPIHVSVRVPALIVIAPADSTRLKRIDREQAQRAIRTISENYLLELIRDLKVLMASESGFSAAAEATAEVIEHLLGASHCLICRGDSGQDPVQLYPCLIRGFPKLGITYTDPLEESKSVSGTLIRKQSSLLITDYRKEHHQYPSHYARRFAEDNHLSFLGARIELTGKLVGTILVSSTEVEHFRGTDHALLEIVANTLAPEMMCSFHLPQTLLRVRSEGVLSGEQSNALEELLVPIAERIESYKPVDSLQIGMIHYPEGYHKIETKPMPRQIELLYSRGWDLARFVEKSSGGHPIVSGGIVGSFDGDHNPIYIPDTTNTDHPRSIDYVKFNPVTRSKLTIPINTSGGLLAGVLNVEHSQPSYFEPPDILFYENVARMIEGALDLSLSHVFARQISEAIGDIDPKAILRRVANIAQSTFHADNVLVYEYDQSVDRVISQSIRQGEFFSKPDDLNLDPNQRDTLVHEIIKNGASVFAPFVKRDPLLSGSTTPRFTRDDLARFSVREKIESSVALVMSLGSAQKDNQVVGVIFLNYRRRTEVDKLRMPMETLALSATQAIKADRELRAAKHEIASIRKFGDGLGRSSDLQELWNKVVREISDRVNSEEASVFLFDKSIGRLVGKAMYCRSIGHCTDFLKEENYRPGENLTGSACPLEGEAVSVNVPDCKVETLVREADIGRYQAHMKSGDLRQLVAVPLRGDSRVFGVLRVMNRISAASESRIELSKDRFTDPEFEIIKEMAWVASRAHSQKVMAQKATEVQKLSGEVIKFLRSPSVYQRVVSLLTGEPYNYKAAFIRLRDERAKLTLQSYMIRGDMRYNGDVNLLDNDYKGILHIEIDQVEAHGKGQSDSLAAKCYREKRCIPDSDVQGTDSKYAYRELAVSCNFRSCYYFPLIVEGEALGTLGVYSGDLPGDEIVTSHFPPTELEHLEEIARLLAIIARYAEDHRRNETLLEIFQSAVSRDTLQRAAADILTGITAREGLGFNRAIMFRIERGNEHDGQLSVIWSVGEQSRIQWQANCRKLLDKSTREILAENSVPTPLQKQVARSRVEFTSSDSILKQLSKKAVAFNPRMESIARTGLKEIFNVLWAPTDRPLFCIAPMNLPDSNKTVGYIYVDNVFDERPIDNEDRSELDIISDFAAGTVMRYDVERYINQAAIDIAHHLRQPIAAIDELLGLSLTRLGEQGIRLPAEIWEDIERSRRNAWLSNAMVRRIFGARRFREGSIDIRKSDEHLRTLLNDCRKMFTQFYSNKIDVIADPGLTVITDRRLFTIALFEVVHNAVKYSPADSKVTLVAELDERNVIIRVIDHGPGISESDLLHIFQPYWRKRDLLGQRGETGIGLGLYLAQTYLEDLLGARIIVERTKGGGATFAIVLPRSKDKI